MVEIFYRPTDETAKPWQNGYHIADLKAIASLFKQHDEGLILGAFTAAKETAVAAWLKDNEIRVFAKDGTLVCAIVSRITASVSTVNDFTGEARIKIPRDSLVVKRWAVANAADRKASLIEAINLCAQGREDFWIESWAEHTIDLDVVDYFGAMKQAVKIASSSEIRNVYSVGIHIKPFTYDDAEQAGIVRLSMVPDAKLLQAAIQQLSDIPSFWQQHYSSYNKAQSWTACALRGYGGMTDFIQKPAEMSKKWKEENFDKMEWKPSDTPLRGILTTFDALIKQIPAQEFQRIRLMRLLPGGGELTRHADITDREAGVAVGRVVRLHLPLITNESVLFEGWNINGERKEVRMTVGNWWYLDQRKPHTAKNLGTTERIHLVCDVIATQALRDMIATAHVDSGCTKNCSNCSCSA